ncbi:MAG: GH92 family glycosyl hydrolase, partial [Saprospiraceae bacterium]
MFKIILIFFFSIHILLGQYSSYVNPFIGTGGHGHTFPGPTTPNGMVQLSPDTRLEGWDGCSGYHYSDSLIYGFSHTHLSGTGIPDYCDILLMPGSEIIHDNITADEIKTISVFNKKTEKSKVGLYEVFLEDPKIKVRLTATPRTGIHEYLFPKVNNNWILIDLKHRDKIIHAGFSKIEKNEITGYRISTGWAKEQHIYFSLKCSSDIDHVIYSKDSLKAICIFKNIKNKKLVIQCGISSVDEMGARNNLAVEWLNFNFNLAYKNCNNLWNDALSRIQVNDNRVEKKEQIIIFYTALYHTLIHPSLFQDCDNRYRGMDQRIRMGSAEFPRYTVFSLWDTYRAAHPLYQLVYPEMNLKFAKTFLSQFSENGRLPVWELAGNETFCMIGNHSIPVLVNAYLNQKNPGLLNKKEILKAIESTFEKNYSNINSFQKGYISMKDASESVSKTIENS